jgi:cytochrome c5
MIVLRQTLKVGLCLILILGFSACDSDKTAEKDTSPCASADVIVAEATYASLWANVFSGRCGSCHGVAATGTAGGPDMRSKAAFYANLVDKTVNDYADWEQAQITLGSCLTTPLIKAGKSSESLVVAVLDAAAVPLDCTVKPHKDPPLSVCISNGSLANLKKWIDNGAPQ